MYRMVKMMAARPDHGVGRGAITVNVREGKKTKEPPKKKEPIDQKKNCATLTLTSHP